MENERLLIASAGPGQSRSQRSTEFPFLVSLVRSG